MEQNFAWRHYYWRLTNEGIQFLREFLHLPAEIVPATLKKPSRPEGRPRSMHQRPEGPRASEGSRDAYRRGPAPGAGPDKAGDAWANQLLWNSGVASVVVEQSLLNKGRGAEALQYADARCSLVIEFYSSIDDYSTYRTTAPKFED